jgi:hypothetical protein
MNLPRNWLVFLTGLSNQHIFSAGPEPGKVITFACEAKSSDFVGALHQIAWYLCSGQHQ